MQIARQRASLHASQLSISRQPDDVAIRLFPRFGSHANTASVPEIDSMDILGAKIQRQARSGESCV
ncbi:hypothetical protein LCM28_11810 [Salipiger pacificus]|nr:hypothetical protein [Alloyangia pacifica]